MLQRLVNEGYDGYFVAKSKPSDANVDGVAVFWRLKRFNLIGAESIPFDVGGSVPA